MDTTSIFLGFIICYAFIGLEAALIDFCGWRSGHDCATCKAWTCKAKHCAYKRAHLKCAPSKPAV